MGSPFITPVVDSASVFLPEIFNGRVVFVTGGGSGICREMTKAVVCLLVCTHWVFRIKMRRDFQMRHGANATIVGRK